MTTLDHPLAGEENLTGQKNRTMATFDKVLPQVNQSAGHVPRASFVKATFGIEGIWYAAKSLLRPGFLVYEYVKRTLALSCCSCWQAMLLRLHPGTSRVGSLNVSGPVTWKLHPYGVLCIGDNVRIQSGCLINPVGGHRRSIIAVLRGGRLTISNRAGISGSTIVCQQEITIGEDVLIGGGCEIYDTDFHSLRLEHRLLRPDPDVRSEPIRIERGAFIGAGSIILKGVRIGEEAIIGAGSVVSRSVPPGEVWAGNPARRIRTAEAS